MEINSITKSGEYNVEIREIKAKPKRKGFVMFSKDMISMLEKFTPAGVSAFVMMVERREYCRNVVEMHEIRKDESAVARNKRNRGMAELKKLGIIKSLNSKVVMINPHLVYVPGECHDDVVAKWEEKK